MIDLRILPKPANRWLEQNRSYLLRFCIVVGVFVAGAVFAPRMASGDRYAALVFLLYVSLIIGIIFLRWPVLGLICTILGGMLISFTGPSGLNVAEAGIVLMLGLWILKMVVERRRIQIIFSRTTLPLIIFILVSLISFGIGQLPWFVYAGHAPLDAQLGGLSIFILSVGAFLLVAHLVHDVRWLQALTWTFIGFGSIYVLGRLVSWRSIDHIFNRGFSAGSMFWTWFVALLFGQLLFNRRLRFHVRIICAGILLGTFYVAYFQANDWKSGWLPPLVAVIAIVGFRFWRPAFLLVPLGSLPAYYLVNRLIGTDQYSWGTRLDAWAIVLNIVKANPVLGLGFANYYWITPLFPIRGYAVEFNSHSQYLDILAQTGLVGLACFLWFFLEVGRLAWWLRERVSDGFARAYVYGALGGLIGTLVAAALVDWVLPFVYNIGLTGFRSSVLAWIFLGGLVSLEQIYARGS
jgi:O-antigen ligase